MIEDFNLENKFYYSIADGRSLKITGGPVGTLYLDDDPGREYRVNSYGYRGGEFSKKSNLLVAGCSFTYGMGIPEERIWGNVVEKTLALSTSSSVSRPGASISWIVEKLFGYFYEFGNPEYLVCLFPDAHRFVVPLDGVILEGDPSAKNPKGEVGTHGIGGQRFFNAQAKHPSVLKEIKYLKRPYNIRELYTPELGLYEAIRSIRLLEQYCSQTGIKLIWSTWDGAFSSYLNKINKVESLKFENFFDLNIVVHKSLEPGNYKYLVYNDSLHNPDSQYFECLRLHNARNCSCPANCHQDLIEQYGEKNFHIGTDSGRGEEYAHPGIHAHAHYAERFIEELMLRYPHDFK